jgi:hypothetical protein
LIPLNNLIGGKKILKKSEMKVYFLITSIQSIGTLLYGLFYALFPGFTLNKVLNYSNEPTQMEIFLTRIFGAILTLLGSVLFFIREIQDQKTQKNICFSNLVGFFMLFVVCLEQKVHGNFFF